MFHEFAPRGLDVFGTKRKREKDFPLALPKNARAHFSAFLKRKPSEIFYRQGFAGIRMWINPQVTNPQVALKVEVSRLCLIGHET